MRYFVCNRERIKFLELPKNTLTRVYYVTVPRSKCSIKKQIPRTVVNNSPFEIHQNSVIKLAFTLHEGCKYGTSKHAQQYLANYMKIKSKQTTKRIY